MSRWPLKWASGMLLAAALIFRADSVLACSVCQPGEPAFSQSGSAAQEKDSFFFYLENRQTSKRSGGLSHHTGGNGGHEEEEGHHGEEEEDEEGHHSEETGAAGMDTEKNVSRESIFFASWTPLDRLTLTGSVPFKWITITEQPFGKASRNFRNSGLGDLSFFGTFVLWRDRKTLPSSWVEGRVLLKLPTGRDNKRIGGERDPHLQLGTGSVDWGVGFAGTRRFKRSVVSGSVFYRDNSEGAWDYEYGDVLLVNLAVKSDAQHVGIPFLRSRLSMGGEVNFRYAKEDKFNGQNYQHSGGQITYVTPFVELKLTNGGGETAPRLRLATRLPLSNGGLYGYQREDAIFLVGIRLGQ